MPQLRHHYYRGLAKIRELIQSKRSAADVDSAPVAATVLRVQV
jgi:hypothetical protein